MLTTAVSFVADNLIAGHALEIKTVLAAFFVGTIVGITGMGGGALMTPALIFLGVGGASAVVTADLTAAAVYKSAGAVVHWREGSPNLKMAGWLIVGSVPFAFLGPFIVHWVAPGAEVDTTLKRFIGLALLLAATTYAARLYLQLRRVATKASAARASEPVLRPIPTVIVGAVGGLLVGITSVGSGSVIMIALLMLYPTLSAVRLVGTDLVQAVPLVFAAAVANILANGLEMKIVIPLIIGSVPGSILGSKIAPRVPSSAIRRGIVVVLTVSGLALLDKSGWWPLGYHNGKTSHPVLIVVIGLVVLAVLPFVWGLLRRRVGLPMFGKPTVAEIEAPAGSPAAKRAARAARKAATATATATAEPAGARPEASSGPGPRFDRSAATPAKKAANRAKRQAAAGRPAAPSRSGSTAGVDTLADAGDVPGPVAGGSGAADPTVHDDQPPMRP